MKPLRYNLELPRVVVERAHLSAMQLRRKAFSPHEAMMCVTEEKAVWEFEEKFELDVHLMQKMKNIVEKDSPEFIRALRFWKWVSRASKQDVKDAVQRGRLLAEADLYAKGFPELMDFPWECTCSRQTGGRKGLKADIIILLLDAQGRFVAASYGYALDRLKRGLAGRHNGCLTYSKIPGNAKTTSIVAIFGTVLVEMIFQPNYKSGFVWNGYSSFKSREIHMGDWRSDIEGLEPSVMLTFMEGKFCFCTQIFVNFFEFNLATQLKNF